MSVTGPLAVSGDGAHPTTSEIVATGPAPMRLCWIVGATVYRHPHAHAAGVLASLDTVTYSRQ